jgi:hypothetical protein
MLTYSVGGQFSWYFCPKEMLGDLVYGYLLILSDKRIGRTVVSSS